jgi:hypothetical protein
MMFGCVKSMKPDTTIVFATVATVAYSRGEGVGVYAIREKNWTAI